MRVENLKKKYADEVRDCRFGSKKMGSILQELSQSYLLH